MNPLELERQFAEEQKSALEADKAACQREAAMLKDLVNHPGWEWLVKRMGVSLHAWEEALESAIPVGEGAARMARAQGARIAIKQFMKLPGNTADAYERFIAGRTAGIELEEAKEKY